MKQNTSEGIVENLNVEIRDQHRTDRRHAMISNLTFSIKTQDEKMRLLRQTCTKSNSNLQPHLFILKSVSSKLQTIEEFLSLTPGLIKLAAETTDLQTFKDVLHILTNMALHRNFQISNQSSNHLSQIIKQGFNYDKIKSVQQFVGNLTQSPNERIMNILVPAGVLELAAVRYKLMFESQDDEIQFLVMLCGLMVNSRSIMKELKKELLDLIVGLSVTNKFEKEWSIMVALSDCGHDLTMNRLIMQSQLFENISTTLDGKFTKFILFILKFFINVCATSQGCDLLDSKGILNKLVKVFQNRHSHVKPLVVSLVTLFIRRENRTVLQSPLMQEIFFCFKQFEQRSQALKFELAKLALALLKHLENEKWAMCLHNVNILWCVKTMIIGISKELALLAVEVLGNLLSLDKSIAVKCEHLGIHRDLETLMDSQHDIIAQWAQQILDTFFKSQNL